MSRCRMCEDVYVDKTFCEDCYTNKLHKCSGCSNQTLYLNCGRCYVDSCGAVDVEEEVEEVEEVEEMAVEALVTRGVFNQ